MMVRPLYSCQRGNATVLPGYGMQSCLPLMAEPGIDLLNSAFSFITAKPTGIFSVRTKQKKLNITFVPWSTDIVPSLAQRILFIILLVSTLILI